MGNKYTSYMRILKEYQTKGYKKLGSDSNLHSIKRWFIELFNHDNPERVVGIEQKEFFLSFIPQFTPLVENIFTNEEKKDFIPKAAKFIKENMRYYPNSEILMLIIPFLSDKELINYYKNYNRIDMSLTFTNYNEKIKGIPSGYDRNDLSHVQFGLVLEYGFDIVSYAITLLGREQILNKIIFKAKDANEYQIIQYGIKLLLISIDHICPEFQSYLHEQFFGILEENDPRLKNSQFFPFIRLKYLISPNRQQYSAIYFNCIGFMPNSPSSLEEIEYLTQLNYLDDNLGLFLKNYLTNNVLIEDERIYQACYQILSCFQRINYSIFLGDIDFFIFFKKYIRMDKELKLLPMILPTLKIEEHKDLISLLVNVLSNIEEPTMMAFKNLIEKPETYQIIYQSIEQTIDSKQFHISGEKIRLFAKIVGDIPREKIPISISRVATHFYKSNSKNLINFFQEYPNLPIPNMSEFINICERSPQLLEYLLNYQPTAYKYIRKLMENYNQPAELAYLFAAGVMSNDFITDFDKEMEHCLWKLILKCSSNHIINEIAQDQLTKFPDKCISEFLDLIISHEEPFLLERLLHLNIENLDTTPFVSHLAKVDEFLIFLFYIRPKGQCNKIVGETHQEQMYNIFCTQELGNITLKNVLEFPEKNTLYYPVIVSIVLEAYLKQNIDISQSNLQKLINLSVDLSKTAERKQSKSHEFISHYMINLVVQFKSFNLLQSKIDYSLFKRAVTSMDSNDLQSLLLSLRFCAESEISQCIQNIIYNENVNFESLIITLFDKYIEYDNEERFIEMFDNLEIEIDELDHYFISYYFSERFPTYLRTSKINAAFFNHFSSSISLLAGFYRELPKCQIRYNKTISTGPMNYYFNIFSKIPQLLKTMGEDYPETQMCRYLFKLHYSFEPEVDSSDLIIDKYYHNDIAAKEAYEYLVKIMPCFNNIARTIYDVDNPFGFETALNNIKERFYFIGFNTSKIPGKFYPPHEIFDSQKHKYILHSIVVRTTEYYSYIIDDNIYYKYHQNYINWVEESSINEHIEIVFYIQYESKKNYQLMKYDWSKLPRDLLNDLNYTPRTPVKAIHCELINWESFELTEDFYKFALNVLIKYDCKGPFFSAINNSEFIVYFFDQSFPIFSDKEIYNIHQWEVSIALQEHPDQSSLVQLLIGVAKYQDFAVSLICKTRPDPVFAAYALIELTDKSKLFLSDQCFPNFISNINRDTTDSNYYDLLTKLQPWSNYFQ